MKSKAVVVDGQPMTPSSSAQRLSVKDRLGTSTSAHDSTASKHGSEGSQTRVYGEARRRLIFSPAKRKDHGRKEVEGIPPRTSYRASQTDKLNKLTKMAEEADKALEVLLKQREEIAEQMLHIAKMRDEASSYHRSEEQSRSPKGRSERGKRPELSGHVSKSRLSDRRKSRSPTLEKPKRVSRHVDSRDYGGSRRRGRSREHTPENTQKVLRIGYSHHSSRISHRSRSRSHTPETIARMHRHVDDRHRGNSSKSGGSEGVRRSPRKDNVFPEKEVSSQPEGVEFLVKKVKKLRKQLVEVKQVKDHLGRKASPFSPEILKEKADPTMKFPHIESYDGSGDPYDHSQAIDRLMDYYDFTDAAKCQMFVCDHPEEGC